jgi:integrase
MGFAESQEWIEKNPVKGLRRKGWFKVKACDGRITDDKLPAWFKAVDDFRYSKFDRPGQFGDGCDDPLGRVGADYLEFVVLTGLRRNEAARLTWDGIDFEKRTITIADTKNSDPLTLPMTEVLTTLLERRRKDAGDSQWVFPSPAKKGIGKPLAEPRFAAEKIAEKSGIPHTIHDLRRTFTSVAARMAPYAVVKTLINHRAKTTGDPTMDHYVRLSVEDIRPHLESIHRFFMEKKAAGQGMKLAQATGA